jgi:hypothetical protein
MQVAVPLALQERLQSLQCFYACAAGFRQLFITGLQPIKGVKLTLPTSADCRHDSHTPDQVTSAGCCYLHVDATGTALLVQFGVLLQLLL